MWFSVEKPEIHDRLQNRIEDKKYISPIGYQVYRNILLCGNMQVQKKHRNRGVLFADSASCGIREQNGAEKRAKTV